MAGSTRPISEPRPGLTATDEALTFLGIRAVPVVDYYAAQDRYIDQVMRAMKAENSRLQRDYPYGKVPRK